MNRTVRRLVRLLAVALVLVLALACGSGSKEGDPGQGTTAQAPPQPARTTARDSAPSAKSRKQATSGLPANRAREAVRERVLGTDHSISLPDPHSGRPLDLTWGYVIHQEVNSTTGGRYVVCTDFRTASGTRYDIDYYVGMKDGEYVVEDVVIHKADGAVVLSKEQRDRLDHAS